MKNYDDSKSVSSYLLGYAARAVRQNTDALNDWAQAVGRLVSIGQLEFFKAWDSLWLAAVAGGLTHLEAQQRIGEAFASAKGAQL